MKALIAFALIFVFRFDLSNARANGDDNLYRTPAQTVMDSVSLDDVLAVSGNYKVCFDIHNFEFCEDLLTTVYQDCDCPDSSEMLILRPNFVAFHLSIALNERQRNDVIFKPVLETIPPEKRAEFSRISTPPNFSANLLDWTELELVPFKNGVVNQSGTGELFGAKTIHHTAEVMNVCFPSGCVDPNDAGYLCCPF